MAVCDLNTDSTIDKPYALIALPVCVISRAMSTAACFTFDSVLPHDSYTRTPRSIFGGVRYFCTEYLEKSSASPIDANVRWIQSSARYGISDATVTSGLRAARLRRKSAVVANAG